MNTSIKSEFVSVDYTSEMIEAVARISFEGAEYMVSVSDEFLEEASNYTFNSDNRDTRCLFVKDLSSEICKIFDRKIATKSSKERMRIINEDDLLSLRVTTSDIQGEN